MMQPMCSWKSGRCLNTAEPKLWLAARLSSLSLCGSFFVSFTTPYGFCGAQGQQPLYYSFLLLEKGQCINSPFLFCFVLCSYELIEYIHKEEMKVEGPIYYYIFNTLLFYLLVLHIYWWILMFRMLVAQIKAGGTVSDDVRSG